MTDDGISQEEDLDGLRSLAVSTNPRVLADDGLFGRVVDRLRSDCAVPDQLRHMLETTPEPDA